MTPKAKNTLIASLLPVLLALSGALKVGLDEYHSQQEARRAAEATARAAEARADVSDEDRGDLGQVVEILSQELAKALAKCGE